MASRDTELSVLLATDLDHHYEQMVFVYQDRLYAFALRQTGSPQDAEDIVQEAFIQAYHALKDYSAERLQALHLRPWLYKITLNIFYSRMRRSRFQLISLDMSADNSSIEIEDDMANQPDIIFEGHESLRELGTHLMKLPIQYREAVNLYYFEQLSYQEIAQLLNQPLGTVKSNLHRGIRMLRKALTTYGREAR